MPCWAFSDGVIGSGQDFFERVVKDGHEGVMAKLLSSHYLPGKRGQAWRKIKPFQTLPCVVIGYTPSRRGIRSLLVAAARQGKLAYVAELTSGFTDEAKEQLAPLLSRHSRQAPSRALPEAGRAGLSQSFTARSASWSGLRVAGCGTLIFEGSFRSNQPTTDSEITEHRTIMICKVSLTVSGGTPEIETSATCELVFDGDEASKFAAEQIRRLQGVCLAAVSEQSRLMAQPEGSRLRPKPGTATLRQLLRLYRAASRIPAFDLNQLQHLSRRLYQKPLEELSMLEVAAITSTLNSVIRGMVDVQEVFKEPASAMNGHAGKCFA